MRRSVGSSVTVAVLVLGLLASLPAATATIAVDTTHLELGKIDPGHTSVHPVSVTNTGTTPVDLAIEPLCDCPLYVTVAPESMRLAPAASGELTVTVAVPDDAAPGIHNTRVRLTEVVTAGPGGTGQAAYEIDATFWVRTAALYFDPVQGESVLPMKIVNGYDDDLTVAVDARLVGAGIDRPLDIAPVTAPGSTNARTTHVPIALPFEADDPAGIYHIALTAEWNDPTTGDRVSPPAVELAVARGAAVALSDFKIQPQRDGVRFGGHLENTGGAPVSAWLVVEIVRASGATVTVRSDAIELAPGRGDDVSVLWSDAHPGAYTATGFAAFESASGQAGASPRTAPAAFDVADPGSAGADGEDGGPFLVFLLVAAAAAGIGAAGGALAMRRRRV